MDPQKLGSHYSLCTHCRNARNDNGVCIQLAACTSIEVFNCRQQSLCSIYIRYT